MTRKIDRSCRDHPEQDKDACLKILNEIIVPEFQQLGYLNDSLYAKALFNSLENRGLPYSTIRTKMKLKGVPVELIAELIDTDKDEKIQNLPDGLTPERLAIIKYARKKRLDKTTIETNKLLGRLARAGFGYDTAKWFIDMNDDVLEDYTLHAQLH